MIHDNAAGGASLPPLTDDEKHDAFEWLREFALSTQPGARKAYIALREWSDLKSARSESVHGWIECSDHAKLPNCDDVESVLGWFPGMKEPKQVSPETVKHWALDADPIPGAMWMPLPEAPK